MVCLLVRKRKAGCQSNSSWKEIAKKYLRRKEYELDTKKALGIAERVKFIDFTKKYLQFSKTTKSLSSYRRDIFSIYHLIDSFSTYNLIDITAYDIEMHR